MTRFFRPVILKTRKGGRYYWFPYDGGSVVELMRIQRNRVVNSDAFLYLN